MLRVLLLIFCSISLIACQPKADNTVVLTSDASYHATLSKDGQYALISTANNGVQFWSLADKAIKYQWVHGASNSSNVFDTAISTNNAYAATLSSDSVAIWNIDNGHSVGWWTLPAYAQSVAIANNGHALIGLADGSVMSLQPDNQGLIQFLGHQEKVNSVSISDDGLVALSGGNDGQILLWQAQTGQPLQQWQLDSRITKVLLSGDGTLSFAGDITGNAAIWQSNSGKKISALLIERRQMNVSSARFVNQNTQLLTGTPSKEIFLWQVNSGERQQRWQVEVTKNSQNRGAVVYSVTQPSTGKVMSVSSQGLLEAWDL
ncbi:WD40 repeat domain-containing protein [Shewanella sp. HL-SH8]|uniref:WD40 repeat domain-containing protein n=1 Tax=Shewanella sp. HL-SH8 TaxID=3436242 RepID=UPI003EC103CC